MATLTKSNIGGPPPVLPELPHGGGDDDANPERGASRGASMTGIIVLMCASTMTFGALISTMMIRRGLNTDWKHLPLPKVLWWNTAILLISSVVFDMARRSLGRGATRRRFNVLWSIGCILGTLFLVGQSQAWSELFQRGFYMVGNPSSAFFYVLTWSHAAHVIGALGAVYYVWFRALRYQLGPGRRTFVDVSTVFWHFLDVMWLFIMGMFAYWA